MAQEVAVLPKGELITQVGQKLEAMLHEQLKAFPKDFNETRFLQNCIAVLADTKDIELCRPMSVVRTLIKGAYLGLDFFRKECYVIVYNVNAGTKDRPVWVKDAQFQTDYKGEIKLAKTYGKGIQDVYAKVVQEGDDLEIAIKDGRQIVNFHPKPFNDGKIIGILSVIVFENGTTKYETMSVKEIEETRKNYSKSSDGPSWIKSWGEMAKKTALRRSTKTVDLNFDSKEQKEAYDDGGPGEIEGAQTPEPKLVADPFAKKLDAPKPIIEDAQVVDQKEFCSKTHPDYDLVMALHKQHSSEELWQIEVRIKESRGQA